MHNAAIRKDSNVSSSSKSESSPDNVSEVGEVFRWPVYSSGGKCASVSDLHAFPSRRLEFSDASDVEDEKVQNEAVNKNFLFSQSSYLIGKRFSSLPHHYKSSVSRIEDSDSLRYVDTGVINGSEFRRRACLTYSWFKEFSDEQKNCILRSFLDECDTPQIHLLSMVLQDRLHDGCCSNCQDPMSVLPTCVTQRIFLYLDPVSLARCARVSRWWRYLSETDVLWRRICRRNPWKLSSKEERKQILTCLRHNGTINWKKVLAERYHMRMNWLRGNCHVRTFEGHTLAISCVQFDEDKIVSGSHDSTIKVWNRRTNSPLSVMTLVGHSGTVRCLHLEQNRLVSGSSDTTIKVWDLSHSSEWSSIACRVTMIGHTSTVRCLQVTEDEVLSGSYDHTIKVWCLRTGECKYTLIGHENPVLCMHHSNNKLLSGSCDKTIKIWTGPTLKYVNTLVGHTDAVTCVTFDSTRIVSGSLDRTIRFWNVDTGACLSIIDWMKSEGHTGVVRCLQADLWRIVSASDDKTLKVWCLESGQRLVTLRHHTDGVTCLQFNSRFIVSGSYDKTVKLWDFGVC